MLLCSRQSVTSQEKQETFKWKSENLVDVNYVKKKKKQKQNYSISLIRIKVVMNHLRVCKKTRLKMHAHLPSSVKSFTTQAFLK